MPLTEREKQTQERYDVSAREWLDHSGGPDRACFWTDEMVLFMEQLQENKLVLEVGCGPATDGKYLQNSGAVVLSTDYSKTMLAIAEELNPRGYFAQMDVQDLFLPDNLFNGFWATACLLHLENPEKALKELVRVTKNGGIGFITMKEGEGEAIDPKTGFYFRYYRFEDFKEMLSRNQLQTVVVGRKAGSPNHDWLTYLVRVTK